MRHQATPTPSKLAVQESWLAEARCRDAADLPWIAEPVARTIDQRLEMAGICLTCPVSHDCERTALELGVTSGFWNGRDRTPLPHQCHAHQSDGDHRHDQAPDHGWGAA
ncbi:WhiB family transcriptional regulator [Nocardioides bruguierae]|uniref:WhiB family transcriptional regulator n=1 Tax=Nocardioides bruguierae TaxID=2945102 RepID=A0A9X2DAU1_9ACTN|nr:WhiB family transcriptional regulator [Nocardioides bruguierae]MCM0622458.1 WhiB family transcriptional regulator [Nocardioides bruguierae]